MTPAQPLHNLEAEQHLIACVLANNSIYSRVSDLILPEHFADPAHGRIWEACVSLIRKNQVANAITLRNVFEQDGDLEQVGGASYLARMEGSVVSFFSARDYAALIVDLAQRRRILDISGRLAIDISAVNTEANVVSIAASCMAEINAVISAKSEKTSAKSLIKNLMDTGSARPTSTGFSRLDLALEGGLYPGKLYCVAARMKAGKTALMGSIAYNVARRGGRVLYVALEMGGAEIMARILARHIGCNAIHVMRGQIERTRLSKAEADFEAITLDFDDAPICTIDDLFAKIIAAEGKYDGVIVDYLQLVSGAQRAESDAAFQARVAQTVAAAVKRCPSLWILTAAQLNREGEVRGSDGLRMACDVLFKLETVEVGDGIEAYLVMEATRYTPSTDVGSEDSPALQLNQKIGPYYQEI